MGMSSVTFDYEASCRAFVRDVKSGVDAHFRDTGLSKHANAAMVVKTVILLTAYFGSYTLILSGLLSLAVMWLLCLVMGVAMAGIGFCVAHDALHGDGDHVRAVWSAKLG
jgi:linoleoyl-CoA desaturase